MKIPGIAGKVRGTIVNTPVLPVSVIDPSVGVTGTRASFNSARVNVKAVCSGSSVSSVVNWIITRSVGVEISPRGVELAAETRISSMPPGRTSWTTLAAVNQPEIAVPAVTIGN